MRSVVDARFMNTGWDFHTSDCVACEHCDYFLRDKYDLVRTLVPSKLVHTRKNLVRIIAMSNHPSLLDALRLARATAQHSPLPFR